jgi:hypothetical protein
LDGGRAWACAADRTSEPATHPLAIVAIFLADALLDMRFLILDGELLRQERRDDGEDDEPEHAGRKTDPDHEERVA